jgi:hypothetical protein
MSRVTHTTSSSGGGGITSVKTTMSAVDSSQASSAYANGLRYVPLAHSASNVISFQLVAALTGTFSATAHYAMSSALSANVRLRVDSFVLASGGNPAGSLTTGTAFTVAAANDVLDHALTSAASADLTFAVTAGSKIFLSLTRLGSDGADTHTGDMRVADIEVSIA